MSSPLSLVYQFRLEGHLGPQWQDWFEGLAITLEDNGLTLLRGPVTDQAALHGLLRKVRDLGLPLVSVERVGPVGAGASDSSHWANANAAWHGWHNQRIGSPGNNE